MTRNTPAALPLRRLDDVRESIDRLDDALVDLSHVTVAADAGTVRG